MISTLLTLFIVGIVAMIVIGVALSLIGVLVGVAFALLFKIVPILLVGYIVIRLLAPKPKKLSAEEREWLES
ncbi:hypothetical protein BH23GEM9_BH23GEM9_11450 [soil metagenome]